MATRQPILIGVGQLVHRAADPHQVMEPLEMMAEAVRRAVADADISQRLTDVDSLTVINIISRAYADPAGFLAPGSASTHAIGSTTAWAAIRRSGA
jgi:acetyl-CoA C-acetyltransferase